MSTKAYDYFITGLNVFDAADRIRETINPVFFDAFREQLDLLDERLQENVNATWDETLLADLPSDNQRILPTRITKRLNIVTLRCETRTILPILRLTEVRGLSYGSPEWRYSTRSRSSYQSHSDTWGED